MITYTIKNKLLVLASLLTILIQYGCSGLQPLPTAARSGDTIVLGIGTIRGLDRGDVTATLTSASDPDNPVDITTGIRAVFNLYPDPVSEAARYSVANAVGHSMQTMVVLDLPQNLPTGSATIDIDTNIGLILPNISDQTIEILPGVGSAHDFGDAWNLVEVLDITSLEPLSHGIITTVGNDFSFPISAAQFEIDFDETNVNGDVFQAVVVPKDILDLTGQSVTFYPNITWAHDGDKLKVQVLCPNCVIPQGFFRIHVIYPPEVNNPTLSLVSAKAWNNVGAEINNVDFQLTIGK